MTIQTYFPTSNPATSSSDPNAQSAEGYYWIGWSVLNTNFDPEYFAQQSITYGTRLADDNTTVDPYRFYRYLPTELDINRIPEFRIAYFNAVNKPDNGVIQREPDGTIVIDQFNQGSSIQPWAKLPQSTTLLNDAKI